MPGRQPYCCYQHFFPDVRLTTAGTGDTPHRFHASGAVGSGKPLYVLCVRCAARCGADGAVFTSGRFINCSTPSRHRRQHFCSSGPVRRLCVPQVDLTQLQAAGAQISLLPTSLRAGECRLACIHIGNHQPISHQTGRLIVPPANYLCRRIMTDCLAAVRPVIILSHRLPCFSCSVVSRSSAASHLSSAVGQLSQRGVVLLSGDRSKHSRPCPPTSRSFPS